MENVIHKRAERRSFKGIMHALKKDVTGNTLLFVGAGMLPVMGAIGAAVDMSRIHLVRNRMQQACDAGALAGRRKMTGQVITQADKDEAVRFFRFNFPDKSMGTEPMSADGSGDNKITVALNSKKQIGMSATTELPTTVMQVFGEDKTRVTVKCEGEEYYVNTDVMLVLDTTGSMNCTLADSTTAACPITEKTNSKMSALRTAVKQLYADLRPVQENLEGKNLRLRVGFVQYASTVNVGKLIYAENSAYLKNTSLYRNAASPGTLVNGPARSSSWYTGSSATDWHGCIQERKTANILPTATSIPTTAYDLDVATIPSNDDTRWGPLDPSLMKNMSGFSGGSPGPVTSYADSVNKLNFTGIGWATVGEAGFYACPKPARHLESWSSIAAFNTFVDTIQHGRGGTYHDIGMIWGTRMIANQGIFAAKNPNVYNGVKVGRTIVLVTDGLMAPSTATYGAYNTGKDDADDNVVFPGFTSTSSSNFNYPNYRSRHEKRFNLMCNRAKELGAEIWVIAMLDANTAISDSLKNCASDQQAYKVSDAAALTAVFKQISDKVGNLRIGG
jgi:Flp pilus assembly protein TadG